MKTDLEIFKEFVEYVEKELNIPYRKGEWGNEWLMFKAGYKKAVLNAKGVQK